VPEALAGAYISQHLALLRPNRTLVTAAWLALALWAEESQRQLDEARYGGTKQQLSLDDIRQVRIRMPSLAVQRRVTEALLLEMQHIRRIEHLRTRQISFLLERRRAIVNAAVSGDIGIPGPRP